MSTLRSDPPEAAAPGLPRRFAAMFYDSLLVLAVQWGATALLITIKASMSGGEAIQASRQAAVSGPALQLALLAVLVLFFGWFWTRSGQTLGMQAWRLRVQQPCGASITWTQALLRLACATPSLLLFGAGYWWALIDREGRTWPDRCSGTQVILLAKRRR